MSQGGFQTPAEPPSVSSIDKEDGLFNPCPTPRLSSVLDTRMFTNKIWGFNLLYNLITQPHPSLEHIWSIDWLIVVKPKRN